MKRSDSTIQASILIIFTYHNDSHSLIHLLTTSSIGADSLHCLKKEFRLKRMNKKSPTAEYISV